MKISIIIVSWNTRELLRECLESVFKNPLAHLVEVFVIDNASADGSADMVAQNFPQVNLTASKENLGFGKANNIGIRQAAGDYVLLLNPDTEIFPDTLQKSMDFMAAHPDCGIMGCRMLYADRKLQPSIRRFPSFVPIFLMAVKAPKIFKSLKAIDRYLATDFDYSKTQEVDQVMGAYMFIRKQVLKKIGVFDEDFFIWFEEVDLCLRAHKAGFKVMYDPEASIIHHGGKSFAQQKLIANQKAFFKSAWTYLKKNGLKYPNL